MFGAAWPGFDFDFGFLLKNWLTSHIVGRVLRAWEACTRAGGRRGADYYIFKNIQRYADCRGVQSCIVNLVASSIIIYMYGISRMHDERASPGIASHAAADRYRCARGRRRHFVRAHK